MRPDTRPEQDAAPAAAGAPPPSFLLEPPGITLPKGGGAVRGLGEKFAANPATGSGAFSLPLPTAPGRSGFGPQLTLGYDSANGNGPFGMGWHLSLASITRKTDKGLPHYLDDMDVFLLAGAEDLVRVLDDAGQPLPDDTRVAGYRIRRYQPRVEGLFARVERWTRSDGDVHWHTLSPDNVLTLFGADASSRIQDPEDARRVFSWLACESRDDRGNAIAYEYKAEDAVGVDLAPAHERQRTPAGRTAQRYLKRVRYGNRASLLDPVTFDRPAMLPAGALAGTDWMFEQVFDYGEHAGFDPAAASAGDTSAALPFLCTPELAGSAPWSVRPDPQSTYRPGFEQRSYRRCRRVFLLHHFPQDVRVGRDCLVGSLELDYRDTPDDPRASDPGYSFLARASTRCYERDAAQAGRYHFREQPPLEFRYSEAVIDDTTRTLDGDSLANLPVGMGAGYRWVDLDGEGVSGLLTEQAGAWFFKPNLGPGDAEPPVPRFGPARVVAERPALAALDAGRQQLIDVDGNGALDLVDFHPPLAGFHERDDQGWRRFVPFANLPAIDWSDPNLRFIDLTGDGHADALVTEDDVFTWYPSLAGQGFDAAQRVATALGEADGPRVVFADGEQAIVLADMSGDGLVDIVRVRNGQVCYWPNLGYGRFGRQVAMDDSPWLDSPELFDERRVRLADVDGSGTTDLVYLGRDGARLWLNRSGNAWSAARELAFPPAAGDSDQVQLADLMGNGTACLVWSSSLPADATSPLRYLDLMGGSKPHLLVGMRNNLGTDTRVSYLASTHWYLADKAAGRPVVTRLPFPVHCVASVTVTDTWRRTTFTSTYSYHHGYFDGVEREFRGFGRVEQVDAQDFDAFAQANANSPFVTASQQLFQAPVKTTTWFHTGLPDGAGDLTARFAAEFFPAREGARFDAGAGAPPYRERRLAAPTLDLSEGPPADADEWREALRACKGQMLRQEVCELDPRSGQPVRLFSAREQHVRVRRLQARGANPNAVFLSKVDETIAYEYELDLTPPTLAPDPRITQAVTLRFDDFGNPVQAVDVAYPRRLRFADSALSNADVDRIVAVQAQPHWGYTQTRFTDTPPPGTLPDLLAHRLPVPCEIRTYELTGDDPATGFTPSAAGYFRAPDFDRFALDDSVPNPTRLPVGRPRYQDAAPDRSAQARLVAHARTLFLDAGAGVDPPVDPLPLGTLGARALKCEDYKLALTDSLLSDVFDARLDAEFSPGLTPRNLLDARQASGYFKGADFDPPRPGEYWMRSGRAGFAAGAALAFYLADRFSDPFDRVTTLAYDADGMYATQSSDALGNTTRVEDFDHRVLAPRRLRDANDNVNAVAFDIFGFPVVSAVLGKVTPAGAGAPEQTETGNRLDEFDFDQLNPRPETVAAFFQRAALDERTARDWLGKASARFVHHFGEQRDAAGAATAWGAAPATACSLLREQHEGVAPNANRDDPQRRIALNVSFEYGDGAGQAFVKKVQAEPAAAGGPTRWIANGKTVVNNKGKPVLQYEPYFSEDAGGNPDLRFAEPRQEGVSSVRSYDAPGRLVRVDMPDGSFSTTSFSPWFRQVSDPNDTVIDSAWYVLRGKPDPAGPRPTDDATRAAWLAAKHAGTPAQAHLDTLGRAVVAIAWNRIPDPAATPAVDVTIADRPWIDRREATFTRLDAEGKPLWIVDARGNLVMQYVRRAAPAAATGLTINQVEPDTWLPCRDVAGNLLFQHSMDAGDRWMLMDAAGKPMLAWDANEALATNGARVPQARVFRTEYDELHRPAAHWLKVDAAAPALIEAFEHVDTNRPGPLGLAAALERNLVGQAATHWDPAGQSTVERIDVTGQPAHVTRTLIRVPELLADDPAIVDWSASRSAPLDSERFELVTERDALGRMARTFNWHRGTGTRVAVFLPTYNARGLLAAEALVVRARKTATSEGYALQPDSVSSTPIQAIAYDAKGKKLSMTLGNGATTRCTYDPETLRLTRLYTRRTGTAFATDCDGDPDAASPARACGVQNLVYVYDAAGNVTHVQDDAQQTTWFRNAQVEPSSDYVHDAVYRLIESTGRENAAAVAPPPSREDPWPTGDFPTSDATRNYTQRYAYDAAGNFTTMQHRPGGAAGWTRQYETAPDSNRLASTWHGSATSEAVAYGHDTHGNVLNLNRLAEPPPIAAGDAWGRALEWDWRDMIRGLDMVGGGVARYHHSMDKVRSRKHLRRIGGMREDRIYLGPYELYRRTDANGDVVEEIDSLHLFEGEQRVLLVDDVLSSDARRPDGLTVRAPRTLFRYQFGAFLASAALELDEAMRVISYEEFHPYGTSAFRLMDRASQAPPRRYRFTGLERDEESALHAQGARSCAPWLGRWLSPDPSELADGTNLYAYVHANPIAGTDPGGRETFMNTELFAASHAGALLNDTPAPAAAPAAAAPAAAAPAPADPSFLDRVEAELDPPVVVPEGYVPPIAGGFLDTYVDRSVIRADLAAKANLDLLTSGSVVVTPGDRAGAAFGLVVSEGGYLGAGIFSLVEHFGASILGTVGAGLNAIDERVPGFKTTLESLQGVPVLGPEVELAQLSMRLGASRLLVGLEMSQMTRTAPAAQIFSQLTQEQISTFAKAGRHVMQVEHLDSGLQFFTVSGPGGALGHTEYVSAMFLNELGKLEQGSSVLLSGIYPPCTRSGGCSALLGQIARERGVNFMYLARGSAMSGLPQGAARALPRGISFFEGGVGRVLKSGVPSQISAPPHVRLGIRTSIDW